MSPFIRAQYLALAPHQQQAFQELIVWSNAGTEGIQPSDIAYEKALHWALQVPAPPPQPKHEDEDFEEVSAEPAPKPIAQGPVAHDMSIPLEEDT